MKAPEERQQLWRELEKSLTSLVASFAPTEIDQHNRDLLNDFVENREYGVALEWLDSLIFSQSTPLSADQEQEIQRLALLMNIDFSGSRGEKQQPS